MVQVFCEVFGWVGLGFQRNGAKGRRVARGLGEFLLRRWVRGVGGWVRLDFNARTQRAAESQRAWGSFCFGGGLDGAGGWVRFGFQRKDAKTLRRRELGGVSASAVGSGGRRLGWGPGFRAEPRSRGGWRCFAGGLEGSAVGAGWTGALLLASDASSPIGVGGFGLHNPSSSLEHAQARLVRFDSCAHRPRGSIITPVRRPSSAMSFWISSSNTPLSSTLP